MPKVGLQLYTLRSLLDEDFVGTLEKVANAGYKAVEFHHFGGYSGAELRKIVDNLGLTPISCHVPLDRLENELDAVIGDAKALGLEYLVCPWLPAERRGSKEAYITLAASLQEIGQACQKAGLKFAYHNHDFEFETFDDVPALDILFEHTTSDVVQSELDVYWVARAGQEPVDYITRFGGRLDLLHVKDVAKDDQSFEIVGNGALNWPEIFSAADAAGVQWYIVEQDVCKEDPLTSVTKSLQFLNGVLSR